MSDREYFDKIAATERAAEWEKAQSRIRDLKTTLEAQARELAAARAALAAKDDPELDATDAASPAWWRGHDHTARTFCKLANEILDGKLYSGGISIEPWQATKLRLHQTRAALAACRAALTHAKELFPTYKPEHQRPAWVSRIIGEVGAAITAAARAAPEERP